MIICHDFRINLKEYEARGIDNDFPEFEWCPNCAFVGAGNIHLNGFYWRYAITEEMEVKIPIRRLRCLNCKVNISVLPDFLIPYFQHTIHTLLARVRRFLQQKRKSNGSRQLLAFHVSRFIKQINWVHTFLTSMGKVDGISGNLKKEATKYLKMILDFGESPFLRRSWGHLDKYFMAH